MVGERGWGCPARGWYSPGGGLRTMLWYTIRNCRLLSRQVLLEGNVQAQSSYEAYCRNLGICICNHSRMNDSEARKISFAERTNLLKLMKHAHHESWIPGSLVRCADASLGHFSDCKREELVVPVALQNKYSVHSHKTGDLYYNVAVYF